MNKGRREFIKRALFLSPLWITLYTFCAGKKEEGVSQCLEPRSHSQKTLEVLLDTIIPSSENDPLGKPGAREGCVINIFYDPFYSKWFEGLNQILVRDLDHFSIELKGKKFVELSFEERTEILLKKENYLYFPVIIFSLISFYGGWYNHAGAEMVGFVPNAGGRDFSYGKKLAEEMTVDGNLP